MSPLGLAGVFLLVAISLVFGQRQNGPNADGAHVDSTNSEAPTIAYTNKQYGFTFTLPASWKSYKIVWSTWESDECSYCSSRKIERGPMIAIRNPHWTKARQWVDILLMVLTISQSQRLEAGDISLSGAAPIGPSELGRNGKYVFYLPTRFGMYCDDCPGYDEVNNHILASQPLHPLSIKRFPSQASLIYVNHNYGFSLTLPASWKSYAPMHRSWCPTSTSPDEEDFRRCPIVVLSHFTGSVQHPQDDVPIVIFTLTQWQSVQKGDIVLTDTPVAFRELGRNQMYVFALLPPDYYSFAPDLQIVDWILPRDAFHAF